MTHREFSIISEENLERTHDIREQEAFYAIIHAAAQRGKGKNGELHSVKDLYNREDNTSSEEKVQDALSKHEEAKEWLQSFGIKGLA